MALLTTLLRAVGIDRRLGARGERVARRHLENAGYRVLAVNLRNRFGEVDLLAEAPDRRTIVIVEVKAGRGRQPGEPMPEEHVNLAKRRRLVALAGQIARRHNLTDRPLRFDVVGVDFPASDSAGKPTVRHHVAAFESHV